MEKMALFVTLIVCAILIVSVIVVLIECVFKRDGWTPHQKEIESIRNEVEYIRLEINELFIEIEELEKEIHEWKN